MLTVLETRDYFEGVFTTRKEAEDYYMIHPEKESCRIIELDFEKFPLYALEVGRGNFKYFKDDESVILFLRNLNPDSITKGKGRVFYIFEDQKDNYDEEITTPNLTLYHITEPFCSNTINEDRIGGLNHFHFSYEDLEKVINKGSLGYMSIV